MEISRTDAARIRRAAEMEAAREAADRSDAIAERVAREESDEALNGRRTR